MAASRHWCFTLNNYTEEEFQYLARESGFPWRYIVFGMENAPTTGTPHLQGYVEFDKPHKIPGTKKLLGTNRVSLHARRGTRERAREYCTEDDLWWEFGDFAAGGQGTRNDLRGMMKMIEDGADRVKLAQHDPECYSRHMRFFDRYTADIEREKAREFRKVEVNVLIGDAGAGKSSKVLYNEDKTPVAEKVFTVDAGEAFPFDGYDGEKTILIDDFYGGIPYHKLLRVLDGHQFRVNVKGYHRYALWTKVFITSNKSPAEWYSYGLTPALSRRLNNVTEFRNEVAGNTEPPPYELDI